MIVFGLQCSRLRRNLFFENVPVHFHASVRVLQHEWTGPRLCKKIRSVSNTPYKFHPCHDTLIDETGQAQTHTLVGPEVPTHQGDRPGPDVHPRWSKSTTPCAVSAKIQRAPTRGKRCKLLEGAASVLPVSP